MTKRVTAQDFLAQFTKEIVKTDPMNRKAITEGWAKHLESREQQVWDEGYQACAAVFAETATLNA